MNRVETRDECETNKIVGEGRGKRVVRYVATAVKALRFPVANAREECSGKVFRRTVVRYNLNWSETVGVRKVLPSVLTAFSQTTSTVARSTTYRH